MITLYKDGEASPPLYEVDARGWMAMGWELPDSEEAEAPEVEETPTPEPEQVTVTLSKSDSVEDYLKKLWEKEGWMAIKEIAVDLQIEKPEDGWDQAIPLIASEGWTPPES